MTYCKPKSAIPYIRHNGDVAELNAFLIANGGQKATISEDRKATIQSKYKDDSRTVTLFPGAYLLAKHPGNFVALPSRLFTEQYEPV